MASACSWKPCKEKDHIEYLLDVLLYDAIAERAALMKRIRLGSDEP